MCGRFALDAPIAKIKSQFHLDELADYSPQYNIAPGQDILFICHTNNRVSHPLWLRWGLIPSWAKDKKRGHTPTNARAEGVAENPVFRKSFQSKRGIVVMSGFFEWQRQESGKQPFYIKHKNKSLLAVAALWDSWQSTEGETIHSCCLITTEANELMSPIHNRMTLLLGEEALNIWMNNSQCDKEVLLSLLKPYSGTDLMRYPVTPKMNYAKFNYHAAIEPIAS